MALGNQKTMVSTNRLKERVAKLLQDMIDGRSTSGRLPEQECQRRVQGSRSGVD